MFVDDGMLAFAVGAVGALAAIVAAITPAAPIAAGMVLLAGCLGVLLTSVIQAGKRWFRSAKALERSRYIAKR